MPPCVDFRLRGSSIEGEPLCSGECELLREHHRLPRDVETLAAADVRAHHNVVFADQVGARFGKAGAVALVGAWWQLLLLDASQPSHLVLGGLAAVRAIESRGFLLGTFIEKITLFHEGSA